MVRIYGSYANLSMVPQLSDNVKVNKLADNTESGEHNGDIESCDAICAEFDKVCSELDHDREPLALYVWVPILNYIDKQFDRLLGITPHYMWDSGTAYIEDR